MLLMANVRAIAGDHHFNTLGVLFSLRPRSRDTRNHLFEAITIHGRQPRRPCRSNPLRQKSRRLQDDISRRGTGPENTYTVASRVALWRYHMYIFRRCDVLHPRTTNYTRHIRMGSISSSVVHSSYRCLSSFEPVFSHGTSRGDENILEKYDRGDER